MYSKHTHPTERALDERRFTPPNIEARRRSYTRGSEVGRGTCRPSNQNQNHTQPATHTTRARASPKITFDVERATRTLLLLIGTGEVPPSPYYNVSLTILEDQRTLDRRRTNTPRPGQQSLATGERIRVLGSTNIHAMVQGTSQLDTRCQGTLEALKLVVGVMSRPSHAAQRGAVRATWGREDASVLVCFIIGVHSKRTPVNPWAPAKKKLVDSRRAGGPPRGQLSTLPELSVLQTEQAVFGDVLLLNGTAEIDSGGTSGLKTLPFWHHVTHMLPGAQWVGKADDDTLVNLANLLPRLPEAPSPLALFGTIKWACYSARRFKHERSAPGVACGRTKFAKSRHPGEQEGLAATYTGPYAFVRSSSDILEPLLAPSLSSLAGMSHAYAFNSALSLR